jgi:hypothetical protein
MLGLQIKSMKCFECDTNNPTTNKYCNSCGWPLNPKDYVTKKIDQKLNLFLEDKELFETAIAAQVFEKAWGWAKIHFAILGLLITAFSACLIWVGYDIKSTVSRAETYISDSTDLFKKDFESSETQLQAAKQLKPDIDSLREKLVQTANDVHDTQKILSSKENLAKDILSSRVEESFKVGSCPPGKCTTIHLPDGEDNTGYYVFLLTKAAVIPHALQLQFHIFDEPPTSYHTFHNLIVFKWGDRLDTLQSQELIASYFPDKNDQDLIQTVIVKDGRVFADDQPLPKFWLASDPNFTGNKWGDVNAWTTGEGLK